MKYYISDTHIFCSRVKRNTTLPIFRYRGFSDVDQMNAYMIRQWNAKISQVDEVFLVGDFSDGTAAQTTQILKQLAGKKYLIIGEYDRFLMDPSFNPSLFGWIRDYAEIEDESRTVNLFHYPTICYHDSHGGSYLLYGHIHDDIYSQGVIERAEEDVKNFRGTRFYKNHIINCFCSYSDYVPQTLDEWIINNQKRRQQRQQQMQRNYPHE